MTPLATALLFGVLPITWVTAGLLVAMLTSHLITGDTALKRLPKIFAVTVFWLFWIIYLGLR